MSDLESDAAAPQLPNPKPTVSQVTSTFTVNENGLVDSETEL